MFALLWKDVLLELRTKERLSSLFVLAVLMVVVFVIALSPERAQGPDIAAALLWVTVLFAGMLSVQRAFLLEQERGCFAGVLLCPLDPGSVFLAKLLGNVLFLSVVQSIVAPLCLLFLGLQFSWSFLVLPVLLLLGIIGFSALATVFAAMAVRVRAREVVLPLLLLPLLIPLLIAAVNVTAALLAGLPWAGVWLRVLLAFDVIFVVTGWLIFGQVVQE
jgi:heme exporter protein B